MQGCGEHVCGQGAFHYAQVVALGRGDVFVAHDEALGDHECDGRVEFWERDCLGVQFWAERYAERVAADGEYGG